MLRIEELSKKHNRKKFDCGISELNQYLQATARQHSVKGISRTFVLIEVENPLEILGFFTLTFCEIQAKTLPLEYAKKYPSTIPAAKLARLAVSNIYQRQGLGKHMMVNAIERTLLVSKHIGIIGFFVDAKDDKAKKYYEQFGFITLPDNTLQLFLPLTRLQQAYDLISKG